MKNFVDKDGNSIELEMVVDSSTPGLMTNQDKTKLDGIEAGANKYIQPSSFPATMITQDTSNRFITDAERTAWNAKAANIIATTTVNGLMSAEDKVKLNSIAAGANAYTHPTTHPATMIVEDSSHRFVTDDQISAWNSKPSTAVATTTANGLMSSAMVTKLNSIATNANAYSHPTTSGNKHIPAGGSSGQILRWSADGTAVWGADNNTTYSVATTTANGLMSAADKVKLNSLSAGISYEYGNSGTSYYKKYSDGTLEMWGRFQLNYTNQLWSGTLGNGGISYSVPFTISLPVTTVSAIECNITVESEDVVWASIYDYTSTTVRYIMACPAPSKQFYAYIHWSVKSRWK